MDIRPYRPDDARHVARIYRDAALGTAGDNYTFAQARAWAAAADDPAGFGRGLERGLTLVAVAASGEAVAFGQLEPGDRIAMLYTAAGHGRSGYAAAIHRLLEDRARSAAVPVLHTAASHAARAFFEKQGFELIAAEQVDRGGIAIERLRMAKLLAEPPGPGA